MNNTQRYLVVSIICITTNILPRTMRVLRTPAQQDTTIYNATPTPVLAYFEAPTPSMVIINPEETKSIPGEGTMIKLRQLNISTEYKAFEDPFTNALWIKQLNNQQIYVERKPIYETKEIKDGIQKTLQQILSLTIENYSLFPIALRFTQSPEAYFIDVNDQKVIPYKQDILQIYTASPTIINYETQGIKTLRTKISSVSGEESLILEPNPMWRTQ